MAGLNTDDNERDAGVVDEILEPTVTRTALAQAILQAPANRGLHGNIPL